MLLIDPLGWLDEDIEWPEETEDTNLSLFNKCWAISGDAYFSVDDVDEKLPPGVYRCAFSNNRGNFLIRMKIESDSLLDLPDSAPKKLLDEFKRFWTLRENFVSRGFTFKRGLLLYGPPGSGKTSTIWRMADEITKAYNGVVVFIENPVVGSQCVSMLRSIEPSRPIVTVMEDLDALVAQHGEHGFLALLDGETQTSNVVHIATTNYPESLDKRFVDRPSRFDTVMHVGMPTATDRMHYLKLKEPSLDEETLDRWVTATDGFSVAHLREVIIAVKCFGQDEKEVFDRLRNQKRLWKR